MWLPLVQFCLSVFSLQKHYAISSHYVQQTVREKSKWKQRITFTGYFIPITVNLCPFEERSVREKCVRGCATTQPLNTNYWLKYFGETRFLFLWFIVVLFTTHVRIKWWPLLNSDLFGKCTGIYSCFENTFRVVICSL